MSETHIQEHIDLIAKHEQEFLARRTPAERLGDTIGSFAGSLTFVAIHLFIFACWMAGNTVHSSYLRHFDPEPFSLLQTLVAIEAILLSSFILMRQVRMSRRADERDHLMLQILLLTEKEITAVLRVERQTAKHMGLESVVSNTEIRELSQHTSIDNMAETIKQNLNPDD